MEVVSDTFTHFQCLCPFHNNSDRNSPALVVDKELGLWLCFNPSCGETGDLPSLVMRVGKKTPFEAIRIILKNKNADGLSLEERLARIKKDEVVFTPFSQEVLDGMKAAFWATPMAKEYMYGRGFEPETLEYFGVGYSAKQNMVVVPMHDPDGMPIGLIGRTPSNKEEEKRFKNSKNLPKAQTAWNFHRAKRHGDTVIICEASYDAMRIHQAGYPNVVALLGGSITEAHIRQLDRAFNNIIIFTDFDKKQYRANCRKCRHLDFKYGEVRCVGHRPGRELGSAIIRGFPNKSVRWATFSPSEVYPAGCKDAGDMTDEQIRVCIKNAETNFEYTLRNVD